MWLVELSPSNTSSSSSSSSSSMRCHLKRNVCSECQEPGFPTVKGDRSAFFAGMVAGVVLQRVDPHMLGLDRPRGVGGGCVGERCGVDGVV